MTLRPKAAGPQPDRAEVGVTLMARVQAGDDRAFAELVDHYQARVLRMSQRQLGDRDLAEEVTQEVFVRVYQARDRYRPTARFTTWLFRIVVNLCANLDGRRRRRQAHECDAEVAEVHGEARSPLDRIVAVETADQVQAALARLPSQQRAALLLFRFEGQSLREIAIALDTTERAVKSLLFRARATLRRYLAPIADEVGSSPTPETLGADDDA